MEFKEVKFDITGDISLIVNLAYYEGHPVVETKKTKINYKGTILEVNYLNDNNKVLAGRLMRKAVYSIFSVELVNYLNRLINGDNLYEVYVNNSNKEDKPEELNDYVFNPEEALSSTRQRDIESKYIKDLVNDVGQVDLDLLDQHRNSKYPTCVHNFNEINYVPIYTYIHPTLAKNQGSTIHIMHLGLLFQLLTRIKSLPEFNTQASISALNSAMRANQIGVTMETVNKSQYDDLVKENERLRGKLQKKQDKLDQIIEQNKQLLEDNRHTHQQLATANDKLDRIGEHMTRFTDFIGDSLGEFNLTTASAKYVYLVLDRPSLVNEARDNHTINTNQYLFDTICCLKINRAKELKAHNYNQETDQIIIEYNCSCSLDISKWIKRHFNENNCNIINTGRYIRKIRFDIGLRDEIIQSIQRFLHRSQATKQTILEHIENMEDILENQNTQIQELREQINQIVTLLNEHRPNAVSVYSNGRYRELITQADGSIVYVPRARSSEVELTEEDIRNLKFKDVNGKFVNYKE